MKRALVLVAGWFSASLPREAAPGRGLLGARSGSRVSGIQPQSEDLEQSRPTTSTCHGSSYCGDGQTVGVGAGQMSRVGNERFEPYCSVAMDRPGARPDGAAVYPKLFRQGHQFQLYSYNSTLHVPAGCTLFDASVFTEVFPVLAEGFIASRRQRGETNFHEDRCRGTQPCPIARGGSTCSILKLASKSPFFWIVFSPSRYILTNGDSK